MKTFKLSMIVAILTLALVGYANADNKPVKTTKVVKITLAKALEEPGLVLAIRDQVTLALLGIEHNNLYVATVVYNRVVYKIYGTRAAWIKFFLNKTKPLSGAVNCSPQ